MTMSTRAKGAAVLLGFSNYMKGGDYYAEVEAEAQGHEEGKVKRVYAG